MKAIRTFDTILEKIGNVFGAVGLLSLFVILLASTAEMVSRKVFNAPLHGTLDLIAYLMVPSTFFPLAYVRRRGDLISIRVVVDRLPKKYGHFHERLITAGDLTITAMLLAAAVSALLSYHNRGAITLGQLPVPLSFLALLMVLGLFILLLEILIELFRKKKADTKQPNEGSSDTSGAVI